MPESYLLQLKVPLDPNYLTHRSNGLDSGNESDSDSKDESCDSDDDDVGDQDYKLKLARCVTFLGLRRVYFYFLPAY